MNIKRSLLTIIVCFSLLATTAVYGQLENNILKQKDSVNLNDTQNVNYNFEVFNFYRNTEYFDIIEKGQTYFGSMVQGYLKYNPHKNLMIKVGFITRHDFGSTKLNTVQPVVSISYFKHKWRYNFGMLQGHMNYGFIEPMYNIDRAITNRIENGIQGIYTGKTFTFNNFLVWDEPTYRTTTNQERFVTGFTSEKTIYNKSKNYISFPLQGSLCHRGGQLNPNPNPIYSRINVAYGLKWRSNISPNLTLKTEHYFLHARDFSPTISQPFLNGNANWHSLSLKYKHIEWMINYWHGREYQSPVGTQIYNNYNIYDIYLNRQSRKMLMSRILFSQKLNKGTFIDLRLEPFYDFEYGRFQYNYSCYIKFIIEDKLFKLKK
jgi:hypothetical protein